MTRKMKAFRLHKTKEGISNELKEEKVPIPSLGPNDVLVNVKASGLCGSDIHMIDGNTELPNYPTTLGHEMAGLIDKVGKKVEKWEKNDRVCANFSLPCHDCYYCNNGNHTICPNKTRFGYDRDGAYAEYLKVDAHQLIKVPDNVPLPQAAVATDAVATPFHALNKRCNVKLGDSIAIFGLGGLGTHAVKIAKLKGAGRVIAVDIHDETCERAKRFGADITINSKKEDPVQKIGKITDDGVDISIEIVGIQETHKQSIKVLRPGGRAIMIGLGPEPIQVPNTGVFVRKQYELVGSYAFGNEEISRILELASNGILDLRKSITKKISLEEVNQGLEDLDKQKGFPIRIVATQN